MKSIHTLLTLLIFSILIFSCSEHCDDEDYKRDDQKQVLQKADSIANLQTSNELH